MKPKKNYVPGAMDVCLTPEYGILPVLPYIKGMKVWECASGKGHLANRMRKNGNQVIETDIETGVDFLSDNCPEDFDVIITNPPFGLKYKFIERCYEIGKPFALLMPVETHGAESGQVYFEKHGIETIWLRPRISFSMPNKGWLAGGAQFPTAWFCYNLVGKENSWFDFNKEKEYLEWKKYIKEIKKSEIEKRMD